MQLDDIDFSDDPSLLLCTQQQVQEKTTSVAATTAALHVLVRDNTVCEAVLKQRVHELSHTTSNTVWMHKSQKPLNFTYQLLQIEQLKEAPNWMTLDA
ncbi:unnamed protein product [Schistosoma margrebowiei]|uniref:Uncharacterized protein n=1 Tax=Schistosoma margrebowiei TaxID=48269 RepID=A0A183LDV8_9TREM|nr:unnamed protein product [Schistosoma margrebowiei]